MKPSGYWNLERCKEDALNSKGRFEWANNSPSAYGAARKNKWLDECCSHMQPVIKPSGYWNLERCKEDALNSEGRFEWQKKSPSAYGAARNNNWLDECCSHMKPVKKINYKPRNYWTLELCKEDALNSESRMEWKNKSGGGYHAAVNNKWLDECCSHMKPQGDRYNRLIYLITFPKEIDGQRVYIGLTYNFNNRTSSHLIDKNSPVYKYQLKSKLTPKIEKLTDLLPTVEAQKKEKEFQKKYINDGYIPLYSIHRAGYIGSIKKYWVKEKCIEDALKYETTTKWRKNSGGAYNSAYKNNWLDECCKHMKPPYKSR